MAWNHYSLFIRRNTGHQTVHRNLKNSSGSQSLYFLSIHIILSWLNTSHNIQFKRVSFAFKVNSCCTKTSDFSSPALYYFLSSFQWSAQITLYPLHFRNMICFSNSGFFITASSRGFISTILSLKFPKYFSFFKWIFKFDLKNGE